jgi:undecaprenyl phosphate N,N'-diacetylbacillosamine 1-phosphate transferase
MYKIFFKRLIDFLVAFFGLLLLSPVLIIIFISLLFANQGKPFFFQLRPGKGELNFKIIKFKTMNDKMDDQGNLLPDALRLTRIGRFVRKTSLDELPQLINVLKGDMSLIGPRPLLLKYLPYYTDRERVRHSVRPGISGLAQVNGRNTVGWNDRLIYDIVYVENVSFILDCKIFILTVKNVLTSKDIVIDPGSELENLDEQRKK